MRNTIVLMAMLCTTTIASAQFQLGIKGNYNYVTASESSKNLSITEPLEVLDLKYQSSKSQFSYGVSMYNEKDIIFMNADVLYRKTSQNYRLDNLISEFKRNNAVKQFSYNRTDISIPISAGIKLHNIKIGAGPVMNYMISSDDNLEGIENISSKESKLQMGFQMVLGYVISDRIHVDLRRELAFSSLGDNYNYAGEKIEMRNSPHSISLGIGIFL